MRPSIALEDALAERAIISETLDIGTLELWKNVVIDRTALSSAHIPQKSLEGYFQNGRRAEECQTRVIF